MGDNETKQTWDRRWRGGGGVREGKNDRVDGQGRRYHAGDGVEEDSRTGLPTDGVVIGAGVVQHNRPDDA